MTINNQNQPKDNNKFKNMVQQAWILQLSPISVTLMPSDQEYNFTAQHQELEQKLQKAKHELKESNIFKIDLIKNISNKLDISCNEMLSELLTLYGVEKDPNKKNSLSNIVIDCAKGLLDYSHNLVSFLQQDTKLVPIDLQAFDLEQLVNDTVNKIIPEAKDKGLDLFCNFQYDIAKIIIGDSYWIGAILEQLVANAVKFTEAGKVIVTINLFPTTIAEDNKEMVLQLIIHDTGIGMSEEIQRYIRDQNSEFDSVTGYKGLKLGLSFVKRLINEMHGDIEVESEEGKGTTITCNIPVKLPIYHQ
ncbi:HAMP domain-containing histidine kinase [Rickettsia parkeri]|uniref:sensor histidine kinase n=1 Tax=Rickettsia parkeri TaxID=35792 RepID=UPI0010FBCDBB|nr:HAMP domain-containing sensor histidine kinase [Rickettsia parkeri]QCS24407.1 HAMP domain-containing histidine kinase [Rickettsia parkeri]